MGKMDLTVNFKDRQRTRLNEFKSNSYSYSVLTFYRQNSSKIYIGLVNLMLVLLGPLCVHILWLISIEHVTDAWRLTFYGHSSSTG
jgi:hypothetical protein